MMDPVSSKFAVECSQLKRSSRNFKKNFSKHKKRLVLFELEQLYCHDAKTNNEETYVHEKSEHDEITCCNHTNVMVNEKDESNDEEDFNIMINESKNYEESSRCVDFDHDDAQDAAETESFILSNEPDSSEVLDLSLHNHTSVSALEYCEAFTTIARKANLCKLHTNDFLSLIKSGLPFPNHLPSTEKELLVQLNVNDLFTKRSVCLLCGVYFSYHEKICPNCRSQDKTSIAYVYVIFFFSCWNFNDCFYCFIGSRQF